MRTRALLFFSFFSCVALATTPPASQSPAPGSRPRRDTLWPPAAASFQATQGPAGTGNALEYDELVPLGSAQVGQGPNAGTRVRITNAGGTPLLLGAPQLAGANENDFAVDVESSSLPLGALAAFTDLAPFRRVEPRGAGDGPPGLALRLDSGALRRLAGLRAVALRDFPLPDLGAVTLLLQRREPPIRADSKLVLDGREVPFGLRALVGELQVWSGEVAELPGSRAFLALDGTALRGFLELPLALDGRIHVLPGGPGVARLVRDSELRARGLEASPLPCTGPLLAPAGKRAHADARTPATSALVVPDLAECRLALETDWQLYQKFNSSALLASYVAGLVAAAGEQYFTDVQATLSIAYLGIHTSSDDGWTTQDVGGGGDELLEVFRAAWGTSWPAQADLAHFLSGVDVGPIAYLDVLCDPAFGFGLTSGVVGNIDWSTWTGAPGNFVGDFLIFAHELGHNFGSVHTHDSCPPLDRCWTNCAGPTVCTRGTLMSYCYGCGGVSNVDLRFHPVNADVMRTRVNASCLGETALLPGDFVQYRVRFNPLFSAGAKSATLEFPHDAANAQQPFRVRLSGTAN